MLKLNHVTKTFNPGTVNAKTALDETAALPRESKK